MYQTNFGSPVSGAEIVSLQLAKLNSGITYTSDDALLQLFVDAVAYEIENYIGYPVLQRDAVTVRLRFYEQFYQLPLEFTEITSVTYKNTDGAQIVLAVDDDYDVFESELTLLKPYPTDYKGPITITGKAGYVADEIPKDIKDAALLMFSERELFRENRAVKLNTAAQSKLRPYKKY